MKKSRRLPIGLALIVVALTIGCWIYVEVTRSIKIAYFEWGTVDMIRSYIKNHNGDVPKSWDDLAPYYKREGHLHGSTSLSELEETLQIDFGCLAKIVENRGGDCTVVRRLSGIFYFEWVNANSQLRSAVIEQTTGP